MVTSAQKSRVCVLPHWEIWCYECLVSDHIGPRQTSFFCLHHFFIFLYKCLLGGNFVCLYFSRTLLTLGLQENLLATIIYRASATKGFVTLCFTLIKDLCYSHFRCENTHSYFLVVTDSESTAEKGMEGRSPRSKAVAPSKQIAWPGSKSYFSLVASLGLHLPDGIFQRYFWCHFPQCPKPLTALASGKPLRQIFLIKWYINLA